MDNTACSLLMGPIRTICIYNIYSQNTVKPSDSGGSIRVFSYILIPESSQPHGILDTGYRIQDTGYRIQDTRYSIQVTEYRIQNTG